MLLVATGGVGCTGVTSKGSEDVTTARASLSSPHHVQAATVHQGRELMETDLRGVQDPLDLF